MFDILARVVRNLGACIMSLSYLVIVMFSLIRLLDSLTPSESEYAEVASWSSAEEFR